MISFWELAATKSVLPSALRMMPFGRGSSRITCCSLPDAGWGATLAAEAALIVHAANCGRRCPDADPSDGEGYCNSDTDCGDSAFCYRGVGGWGVNKCKPIKSEGQTCVKHDRCASGCGE